MGNWMKEFIGMMLIIFGIWAVFAALDAFFMWTGEYIPWDVLAIIPFVWFWVWVVRSFLRDQKSREAAIQKRIDAIRMEKPPR